MPGVRGGPESAEEGPVGGVMDEYLGTMPMCVYRHFKPVTADDVRHAIAWWERQVSLFGSPLNALFRNGFNPWAK